MVQALPSLQGAAFAAWVQPSFASQASVEQGFASSHEIAPDPKHFPPAHASIGVQGLPSSQGRAFAMAPQPTAGLQPSVVQGLPSSHALGWPEH
jgi:hypothetical protein